MTLKPLGAALLVCFTALAQAQEAKPGESKPLEIIPAVPPPSVATTPPPAAKPAPAPSPSPFTFALHGFVSMSAYQQDAVFGLSEGQQALFVSAEPATDKNALGFDVRQSRFNLSLKGPAVLGGATPSGVLEFDFFQGFGAGAFGDVSLLNRMRLAYSELNWGNHRLAFGQMNDLVFAMAPVSLAHIAFPLGYGTGNIGWRRPGVFGFHSFGTPDLKVELAWEVGRSQWNDAATGIGANAPNTPAGVSLGEASSLPATEARLTVSSGTLFSAFAAGHWNRVDLNGAGFSGGVGSLDVLAVNAGGKLALGPLTVAATGFTGKNTGPLLGNLVQLQAGGASGAGTGAGAPAATKKDVSSWGGWAQAGLNVTKELSAWAFYGLQKVNEDDAKAASLLVPAAATAQFTRLENQTTDLMLQYRDGGYALGLEWIHMKTKTAAYAAGTNVFTGSKDLSGNEYMASANYFF